MSQLPDLEKLRANRWQVTGITIGILVTLLFLPEGLGFWRYLFLFLGGAIGALLGRIALRLWVARKP